MSDDEREAVERGFVSRKEALLGAGPSNPTRSVIEACPECDASTIRYRVSVRDGPPWRCKNGHEFDEPITRPRRRIKNPYETEDTDES